MNSKEFYAALYETMTPHEYVTRRSQEEVALVRHIEKLNYVKEMIEIEDEIGINDY